jgi:DNA-binding CsgD family transcriptional regulator
MPLNNRSDRLLRLLLPLHESPHSGDAWNVSLSGLSRLLGCEQVGMVEREGPLVADAIAFGAGSDERFTEEYRAHFVHLDPYATTELQALQMRSRRALHTSEMLAPEQLRASPFYNDYWKRWRIEGGLAAGISITGRRQANFCALHGPGRELDRDDRVLFDVFVCHARAALRQRHALRLRDAALRGLLDSTDCLADAVFVVDGVGSLVQSNAAADELIELGDVVRLRGGELRLGRSNGHDPLSELVAEIIAPPRSPDRDEPVRCLAIRDGTLAGDELLVTAVRTSVTPARGTPAAILFLRRSGQARPAFRPQHLRDLFGFTPAESRIANALLAGERVEEIAGRLAVRADTVRGHIKRMLAKTGTRKQADLVGRLASAVPTLRVFAPAA